MLSAAPRGRKENEKHGTEVLVGRPELDGLGRHGDHEYGLGHPGDRSVWDRNSVADDCCVKLLHDGQSVRDFSLAFDDAPLGECVGQNLDGLIARAGAESAHRRIVFNKIY